jgi:nitrite reductase/ring-hydroxylating ferredoxin subunit
VTTDSRTPATETAPTSPVARATCLHRRHALAGVAAVGVGIPFLAACSGDDSDTATDPAGSSGGSTGGSTPSDTATSGGGAAAGLASTADIPVGGGVIFADEEVVIVQPTEGEFLGWSTVCTHQGCAVSEVTGDGEILCPCHNSLFSIEDGAPTSGPASAPLEEIALTVTGDQITLA